MASIFNTSKDDQIAIENRRRLAEALMARGSEPLADTGMAGGLVVPTSPLSALNKVFQSVAGSYLANRADKQRLALQDKQNEALLNVDFNSPDAPKQLLASGQNDIAMALLKQRLPELKTGTPGMGFIPRGSKPYTEETTGFTGFQTPEGDLIPSRFSMNEYQQAMTDPERRGEIISREEQARIVPVKLPDNSVQLMTKGEASGAQQSMGNVDPTVAAIGQVESGNNPNAQNPDSTASGQYQFTNPTRQDAGLVGATPEQETAMMQELQKARMQRYGGNEDLSILSHNIGVTGADEVGSGKRALTPQMQAYINSVKKAKGAPIRSMSPASEAAAIAQAKQPIELATKQAEANIESQKKLTQTKQEALQQEQIGAQKTQDTLNLTYKYLYPGGIPERDQEGNLIPPKEKMVLGNTPGDRLEAYAHETLGTGSKKAVNTNSFKREVRKMVLDLLGGKLGAQISDADRGFIVGQVSNIENAQHIDDIYSSMSALEDRIKMVQSKAGGTTQQPTNTQKNQQNLSIDDLVNIYKR